MAGEENSSAPIRESDLRYWSLLGEFSKHLDAVSGAARPAAKNGGPPRLLTEPDYLRAFLFLQFNAVIETARGLSACSDFKRVQQEVCSRHISLGSFSEAQHVFGSELLEKVFGKLVREDPDAIRGPGSRCANLCLIDSTILRALPRMGWAEWRHQKTTQRAARLHLKFGVFTEKALQAVVSEGRMCERKAFRKMIKAGEFYVGDRYYGREYALLGELERRGCGYVMRLFANSSMTKVEDQPLQSEDIAAGVISDQIVRLGWRKSGQEEPVRVVVVRLKDDDEPLYLVTNRLDNRSHSAALIAEIYRQRWQIEMFFRWFKCVLGRANQWHWVAESERGVAIQIYTALIAALLLARHVGKLPNKREMEFLRFMSMGMAEPEEVARLLARKKKKAVKRGL